MPSVACCTSPVAALRHKGNGTQPHPPAPVTTPNHAQSTVLVINAVFSFFHTRKSLNISAPQDWRLPLPYKPNAFCCAIAWMLCASLGIRARVCVVIVPCRLQYTPVPFGSTLNLETRPWCSIASAALLLLYDREPPYLSHHVDESNLVLETLVILMGQPVFHG